MPFRTRRSAAILCLALAVFVTVVSIVDIAAPAEVLAPVWQAVPDLHGDLVRQQDSRRAERTLSLLASLPSRAPPSPLTLA